MRGRYKLLFLPVVLAVSFLSACSARVGYRVYDPGYNDYHVWDNGEVGYYNNWVVETHRPNRDFRKLNKADQNEYWKWRHDHH
jgi:hypothetical protein